MKYKIIFVLLLFLASIKTAADVFGWQNISVISAASNLSPAMKVFTAHGGYETYSSKYFLEVSFSDGTFKKIQMTPQSYANIEGPYNRRNVYGALIAYGPILYKNEKTKPMWWEMGQNIFCSETEKSQLKKELDINKKIKEVKILYKETKNSQNYPTSLTIQCHD